jgi:hypothetical protein
MRLQERGQCAELLRICGNADLASSGLLGRQVVLQNLGDKCEGRNQDLVVDCSMSVT